jgi:hypothetical protein
MTIDRANFALHLMDRYHAILPQLKALRSNEGTPEDIEAARFEVSYHFGSLFTLYRGGFIDAELLQSAISPGAAKLFIDHVAPLDKAVRERTATDPDGYTHPVEEFWREYAHGRLRVFS